MPKLHLAAFCTLLFLLSACQTPKPSTNQVQTSPEVTQETTPSKHQYTRDSIPPTSRPIKRIDDESILALRFERTGCYGTCPIYTVKLYESGYATYEGRRFVERMGMHEFMFDSSVVKQIRQEALRINFFELAKFYPTDDNVITDLPSCITQLRLANNKKHRVEHKHDGPQSLTQYEKYIDSLLLPVAWQPFKE